MSIATQPDRLAASRGESSLQDLEAPPRARDAPIGGQAVIEGVMMRGVASWAVAFREPTSEQLAEAGEEGLAPMEPALGGIRVERFPLDTALRRHAVLRLPVLRGVVALGASLRIGTRALRMSADAHMGDPGEDVPPLAWAFALVAGLGLAIGLFFLVPVGVTSLLGLESATLFWLVEGVLRTIIFLLYLVAVTRLRDLRRLFEYHGAEHKVIACYEAGLALTPANAQRFSRLHPRCGTSFMLIVMLIAIFAFAPIGLPAWYWLMLTRVLGVPLIAGLAFEVIKALGRHRDALAARVLTWPGMQLQRLTTAEPDHDELLVAIAALEAVLELEPERYEARDLVGAEVTA